MNEKLREKWVPEIKKEDNDKCPSCKERSEEPVFPFGDDAFYCKNPLCLVTRFTIDGFYIETLEPLGTPKVQEILPEMKKKRE